MSPAHHARRFAVVARRVLVRRPWLYWLVVAGVAVALAASVLERVDRVDATRDAWGATRPVLVATGHVRPGEPLAFESRAAPAAIVPEGAITDADGLVARQRIGPGEIITDTHVAPDSGPLALVPDGWLAVPVVESPRSGAGVGERVQVASDGVVVSDDALVVGLHDDVTLVAVPVAEAPLLPAASDAGGLTLLLVP